MEVIHPLANEFSFNPVTETPLFHLFLIHGFSASPTEVKPFGKYVYDYFNSQVAVTSILLPGHGISGDDGYKILDHIKYQDWISAVNTRIDTLRKTSKNVPLFLGGLSMGSALISEYLSEYSHSNISGAILLAPPFFMQGKLILFIGIIKYFLKYQFKGEETVSFFKRHGLFSYYYRSINGVNEFYKLIKRVRKKFVKITTPVISVLAEQDEMVDNSKTKPFLEKNGTETFIMHKAGHILTVEENSAQYFEKICQWIELRVNN